MRILLNPDIGAPERLREVYKRAFQDAEEIFIATAYLTDWDSSYALNGRCKRLTFLVGTDFGLTRKKAMLDVLRWIPKNIPFSFFGAVQPQEGGFHPKIIAWREFSGKMYCMIGSSNLSKAGFSSNFEANVLVGISKEEFRAINKWAESLMTEGMPPIPISRDWIERHYIEARYNSKKLASRKSIKIIAADLPKGKKCERRVLQRRKQQKYFAEIAKKIKIASIKCAKLRSIKGNREYWKRFWSLWANHPSRFQGSGIQFKGSSAKWHEVCASLIRILNANTSGPMLDAIVSREIDKLHKYKNPMRGAWLSEMLCHYFPHQYPIKNKPVKKWLTKIKLRGRRGATEGQHYVELAQQLRYAVQSFHPAGAQNLAELDSAIWKWTRK